MGLHAGDEGGVGGHPVHSGHSMIVAHSRRVCLRFLKYYFVEVRVRGRASSGFDDDLPQFVSFDGFVEFLTSRWSLEGIE